MDSARRDRSQDTCRDGCHTGDFADFDHYCDMHNITDDEVPAAFGAWLNEKTGWDGPQNKVE